MMTNPNSHIEHAIREYIEEKEKWLLYTRKRNEAEKEYNKLLSGFNGEGRNYNLTQADKIYNTYREMLDFEEKSNLAQVKFAEAEERLKEIGRVLFEATITAEISLSPINGIPLETKNVTVRFNDGQVMIN